MPRSARSRTSNISTCPRRSAALTSISRKPVSIGCAVPAITAASQRWKTRSRFMSKTISIAPIVSAEAAIERITMFDFEALSHAISGRTVLCVGDLMLDEFVYGEVSRISPEAPAPVIAARRSETNIGGAGNVARNIASLGGRCIFVGLVGADDAGARLKAELGQHKGIKSVLVSDPARPTTRKVRFVS